MAETRIVLVNPIAVSLDESKRAQPATVPMVMYLHTYTTSSGARLTNGVTASRKESTQAVAAFRHLSPILVRVVGDDLA